MKANLGQNLSLEEGPSRSSMYAKPVVGGQERVNVSEQAVIGPSQYSLLGHNKYENVDLNEIQATQ